MLFINDKMQLGIDLMHFFRLILHVEVLRLLQEGLHPLARQEFDQGLVLGQTPMCPEQFEAALLVISRFNEFFGFVQLVLNLCFLRVEQFDHMALEGVELLLVALWRGA